MRRNNVIWLTREPETQIRRIFQLFRVGREEKEPGDLNTIDYHPIHITMYLIIISEALMVFNINILNIARNYYS